MASPLQLLHRATHEPIRRWVLGAFPRDPGGTLDYDQPHADPGLFGPDSVTWRIHADFPGMLAGGLAALMMQTLHPLALAGVWDHSNFRGDLVGRLRRTTTFVGATTYAPRAAAEGLIERVRRIHAHVHGMGEDGTPYSADDPALLTWVHVTEAHSFLAGYRRFAHRDVPRAIADRYYDEVRRIAEALGARDVPASEADVADYFARVQPQLAYTDRSREVLRILAGVRLPVPLAGLSRDVFLNAGIALLPGWASDLLRQTPRQRQQARLAARVLWSMAPAFRAALTDGVVSRAGRRVGMAPEAMRRWPSETTL
ncbi:oxygenase MpaB family protein [Frateuria sp. STR12]|uniref:oxygenase MpaB family protein n=1 Tax=Frateuria hangzhouensis TaxID=2995589 RepID=UPI002260972A|nr:oxygenase MpaB family protein [Frateuria sp. STR12]MCX7513517.1 oxygenase MpaB family protein [Frateuria sp. STR12]